MGSHVKLPFFQQCKGAVLLAVGSQLLACVLAGGCAATSSIADRPRQVESTQARRLPVTEEDESIVPAARPTRQVVYEDPLTPQSGNTLFSGPMPVEQLIAYAVTNNPEIAAARSRSEALLARVPQARSLEDPILATTVFLEEIQTAAGPQQLMLSLSQKFPWFGKRDARGEIACHNAQVAYAELANIELGVVEQVRLAYCDLYFIDQAIRLYRELHPSIEDVITITQARYETNSRQVGLESVLQAEVTLHKLQITLAELEQARLKALARLEKSLHVPDGLTLEVQPTLVPSDFPQHVDALVALLEQCQPQLEARRQAILRDNWSVALAEKNYFPDTNVGLNWYAIGGEGLSPVTNGRDACALMIGVNLPVYKAKRDAALREACFQSAQSAELYDASWDALRADVRRLHAEAVEHDRVLQILDESILRKSQQTFELSIEAYRVDRIGFQQLIDNYESLLRFRLDHHLRRVRREQAIAQLERAVGCAVAEIQPEAE
jgi:outer membrane protein TolC